ENLTTVRARIDAAAQRVGRDPREITLVAVTKDVGVDAAREGVALGLADLGENRVQELKKKQAALSALDVRWHMIGTLQRNKVAQVVARLVLIHSVHAASVGEADVRR